MHWQLHCEKWPQQYDNIYSKKVIATDFANEAKNDNNPQESTTEPLKIIIYSSEVFTARYYAERGYAYATVCRLSVRLSVRDL